MKCSNQPSKHLPYHYSGTATALTVQKFPVLMVHEDPNR